MQFKISVLGAILAASSSVLAAPTTSLLSPDAAIKAVDRLTTETTYDYYQLEGLRDSNVYNEFVTADISFLNRIVELKEKIYHDIGGVLESDRLDTNTLLEGLIDYSLSCADEVTPEIEQLKKVEKEAVAAYGFSVDE
ncbi:hypothetical protein N7528_006102 [Penicillium herquei]|nr:hypothetical protein N7528_006102 [Penicillium herquei]